MKYLSTSEVAKKWGVSQRRVVELANNHRIDGARLIGSTWMVPENAQKPADGRTKAARGDQENDDLFRFPFYLGQYEEDFIPPLTDEEKQLRQAAFDFHALRLEEAKKIIYPLSESAENRYVRIAALYYRYYLSRYDCDIDGFNWTLASFKMALTEDFPYKKEMMLLRYRMNVDEGNYESLLDSFTIDPLDPYDASVFPLLMILSIHLIQGSNISLVSKLKYDTYELMCEQLENDAHYLEAQELHFSLLQRYHLKLDTERAIYHLRRAIDLAVNYELYFRAALETYYYPEYAEIVFADYPNDFTEMIRHWSVVFRQNYLEVSSKIGSTMYWSLLSYSEIQYVDYALQGYSNKAIAEKIGVSEKTVSNKYSAIYTKLGIDGKQELVSLVTKTLSGSPS